MNSQQSRSIIYSQGHTVDRLRRETIEILRKKGLRPRRRLGQSFVIDQNLIDRMIELSDVSSKDTVLEIGAGLGTLTKALAERCKKVYAIEIDRRLCSVLSDRLSAYGNVYVVCGDALKIELPNFQKIVSNPPFYISSKLLFRLLTREFQRATMTFQNEFVSRLLASPGSEDYGRLTISTRLRADVEAYEEYPTSSFFPQPKTKARIIVMKLREPRLDLGLSGELDRLLVYAFSQRRRMMRRVLEHYAINIGRRIDNELLNSFGDRRVFQIEPQEFVNIAKALIST
ncbi:MAG: 16S rRNA (adenine(1518)-N(6)/adenine(1519)-N(6))-dimethyltransferase RsmA [Thermoproteota archaeon]